jgi:hypothetical protein
MRPPSAHCDPQWHQWSLCNRTLGDVYFGRREGILQRRRRLKVETVVRRKAINLGLQLAIRLQHDLFVLAGRCYQTLLGKSPEDPSVPGVSAAYWSAALHLSAVCPSRSSRAKPKGPRLLSPIAHCLPICLPLFFLLFLALKFEFPFVFLGLPQELAQLVVYGGIIGPKVAFCVQRVRLGRSAFPLSRHKRCTSGSLTSFLGNSSARP